MKRYISFARRRSVNKRKSGHVYGQYAHFLSWISARVYPSRIDYLRTERGVKPVRMENLNGCSSHATQTVHWLLIDSNRNYPADVVDSRYNRVSFSPRHRHSLSPLPFSLYITSRLFLGQTHFFLAVATRSSRRPEGYPLVFFARSHRTQTALIRVMYPFRKRRAKITLPFSPYDQRSSELAK